MKRAARGMTAIVAAWALTACGGSTTAGVHSSSAAPTPTTSAPAKASTPPSTTSVTTTTPIAQDKNPSEPDYWAPQYENGLSSSCVSNKIAPTESMCNCIVALIQSHHPALAEQASARDTIQQWMRTASGNPFGLRDYALRCGQG